MFKLLLGLRGLRAHVRFPEPDTPISPVPASLMKAVSDTDSQPRSALYGKAESLTENSPGNALG